MKSGLHCNVNNTDIQPPNSTLVVNDLGAYTQTYAHIHTPTVTRTIPAWVGSTRFITYTGCPLTHSLGVNARGCWPTPSSRWRRTLPSPWLITGKFTDKVHVLETHTSWGYCPWCEEHWCRALSRDRQSFSRDSNLKSCVVTRVAHISVYLVSRVTVFHVEGDATVDEDDACWIVQTVIDISRFHFCYSCLFCPPLFNITRFNIQWTKPIIGNAEIKDGIWWNDNKFWHWAWYLIDNERCGGAGYIVKKIDHGYRYFWLANAPPSCWRQCR